MYDYVVKKIQVKNNKGKINFIMFYFYSKARS